MAECKDSKTISELEEQAKLQAINNKSMINALEGFKKMIDDWKTVPLSIGVFGSSGAGKSSFINAMRGLLPGDVGAAAVGVTGTTRELTKYPHPGNALLAFWYLPYAGICSEDYLEQVCVSEFDYFVIITAGKFTDTDAWFAKNLDNRKKKFYFLRTKIEIDVTNERGNANNTKSEQQVVDEIRESTLRRMKEFQFDDRVFLIDSEKRFKYDFDEFEQVMIQDLPNLKREAMILSLSVFTASIVKLKAKELRVRAGWTAGACVTVGSKNATAPRSGIISSTTMLYLMRYFRQLGLNDASLKQRARFMFVDFQRLKDIVERDFPEPAQNGWCKMLIEWVGLTRFKTSEEMKKIGSAPGTHEHTVEQCLEKAKLALIQCRTELLLKTVLTKMEKTSLELSNLYLESKPFTNE